MDTPPKSPASDPNSLEETDTQVEKAAEAEAAAKKAAVKKSPLTAAQKFISRVNIYLLLFILIIVLAGGIVFISIQRNKKSAETPTLTTQTLTAADLAKLKGSDATVGDPKQTLTIESNAIFSGKVLIRDSLDIAGGLKVGGDLALTGLTVSGSSTFDTLAANNLSVAGDTTVQGDLKVLKGLNVSGGGTFGGTVNATTITVQSLLLGGDLQIPRHIDGAGSTPTKSNGAALGSGGTATVNGSDTAGTVTINMGSGAPSNGCFITVVFSKAFSGVPHVVVSPVGLSAASINFYITRNTSSFTLCHNSAGAPSGTFNFDYMAFD